MDNAKEYLKSKNIFINERVGEDNLTENSHLLHELLDEYAQQQVKNTVDLADVGTSLLNIKSIINKGENTERAFFNWFKENGIYWGQRGSNLENILVYETDIETIKDYWEELN
jgi:hypothetical protein